MDRAAFLASADVSRETAERLDILVAELQRWNKAINLVAPGTLNDLWRRHILDSWQLLQLAHGTEGRWIDLGSGGGFPGLVIAASGWAPVTLIESDKRKAQFLREAARKMAVIADIRVSRIEDVTDLKGAVISARALAPLTRLLDLAVPLSCEDAVFLFPKGQDVEAELTQATKCWRFEHRRVASLSDSRGTVLVIRKPARHDRTQHT